MPPTHEASSSNSTLRTSIEKVRGIIVRRPVAYGSPHITALHKPSLGRCDSPPASTSPRKAGAGGVRSGRSAVMAQSGEFAALGFPVEIWSRLGRVSLPGLVMRSACVGCVRCCFRSAGRVRGARGVRGGLLLLSVLLPIMQSKPESVTVFEKNIYLFL